MVQNDEAPENDVLRSRIKLAANNSNLSVDEYIVHVLEQATQLEEGTAQAPQNPLTQEQLARVLQVSEQIRQST